LVLLIVTVTCLRYSIEFFVLFFLFWLRGRCDAMLSLSVESDNITVMEKLISSYFSSIISSRTIS